MRVYHLIRHEDETGNSGTGFVAEAVVFSDGHAVLRWLADRNALAVSSTVVYPDVQTLLKVHGHGGKTILREVTIQRCAFCGYTWDERQISAVSVRDPRRICAQCYVENVTEPYQGPARELS